MLGSSRKKNLGFSKKKSMRFSRRKRRNLLDKKLVFVVIAIIFLSCGTYVFAFSEFFMVSDVEISGNENLNEDRLRTKINSDMETKQEYGVSGKNFFMIDTEKIADQIKSDFPEVKEVEVEKTLPNKLAVKIEEEEPALIWCRNQDCFFINAEGTIFMDANESDLVEEGKYFVKIMETEEDMRSNVLEEETVNDNEEGSSSEEELLEIEETDNVKETVEKEPDEEIKNTDDIEELMEYGEAENSANIKENLRINDRVSDSSFINFLLDINREISYNTQLDIKYYQTKGNTSRELIAITDKNIRIYFDATKEAKKQAKNLGYFLSDGIDKKDIDTLEYIYLKTEDRIFYK